MRVFLSLFIISFCFCTIAQAQKATICEENTQWVEAVGECVLIIKEESDLDLEEIQKKAEGVWGKIQNWYEGLIAWKESCTSPLSISQKTDLNDSKGSITILQGAVQIRRGDEVIEAETGMELYSNDTIEVEADSSATIELPDTGLLEITQNNKYQIPDNTNPKNNIFVQAKNFLENLWEKITKCTKTKNSNISLDQDES